LNSRKSKTVKNTTYQVIKHGRVKTSVGKAKEVKKKVERLITKAKSDKVKNRRYAAKYVPADAVKILFEKIGPANKDREGGYTRILRLGKRQGDSREDCVLEIIDV